MAHRHFSVDKPNCATKLPPLTLNPSSKPERVRWRDIPWSNKEHLTSSTQGWILSDCEGSLLLTASRCHKDAPRNSPYCASRNARSGLIEPLLGSSSDFPGNPCKPSFNIGPSLSSSTCRRSSTRPSD